MTLATHEISAEILDVLMDHTRTTYLQENVRRQIGVSDVVVSWQMKRWHAVHTLETTYRDAFNNQLNDRYQAKMLEYHELSRDARAQTMKFGIGVAMTPLGKAQAPVLSLATGQLPAAMYFVQVSWVSASGQEGAPSDALSIDAAAGSAPVVSAVNPPAGATGFNVYMGLSPGGMALQSSAPLGLGQSYTLPNTGLAPGRAPGNGQGADIYIIGGPLLRRG